MLLLRGATGVGSYLPTLEEGFNTCSSCEEQQEGAHYYISKGVFQYMLLLRGATQYTNTYHSGVMFQYMLLLRGATSLYWRHKCGHKVSIHAPLARSNSLLIFQA